MSKTIQLSYRGPSDALAARALEILSGRAEALGATRVGPRDVADLAVTLTLDASLAAEAFRIHDTPQEHHLGIEGGDGRGLLYGVGKLIRGMYSSISDLVMSVWRGTSRPTRPIRGMYFATHFGNYYETAPVEEIKQYVEELALWGCNTLSVWFDMHQYAGLEDPSAQRMVARLRSILQAARSVGMRPALTALANEGYANSPESLRADWTAGHDGYTRPPGGHYHREICPSRPGGLAHFLRTRREMLEAFSDIGIEHVWIWPYDQGGCTCSSCAPWGANGFLRTAEPLANVIHQELTGAKVMLSTWYLDHFTTGEWRGLSAAFSGSAPPWVDCLIAGDFGNAFPQYVLDHDPPGCLPVFGFPEISMEGNSPWGGYGANPRPSAWEAYERRSGSVLSGAYPYSEGIFEDINKVLMLQLNWDSTSSSEEIVHEYAAAAFSPRVADDVVDIAMSRHRWPNGAWIRPPPSPPRRRAHAFGPSPHAQGPTWSHTRYRARHAGRRRDTSPGGEGGAPAP